MVSMLGTDWRALVVDGDTAFVGLAEVSLRAAGASEVRHASSGEEALSVLGTFAADVVLIEVGLVGMDGVQLTARLRDRARSPRPDVLVVLTAAEADPELMRAACRIGIESFVRKPILPEVLARRITAMIANPARFVAAQAYHGPDRRHRTAAFAGAERRGATDVARGRESAPEQRPAAGPGPAVDDRRREDEVPRPAGSESDQGGESNRVPARRAAALPPSREWTESRVALDPEDAEAREWNEGTPSATMSAGQSAVEWAAVLSTDEDQSDVPGFDVPRKVAVHLVWLRTRGKEGRRAVFASLDLHGAILTKANLTRADFGEADLSDADCRETVLRAADLQGADLSGADLTGAVLAEARLRRADLRRTRLDGADLRGVDLAEVDLAEASLDGADLRGADLRQAIGLSRSQLDAARTDSATHPLARPGTS